MMTDMQRSILAVSSALVILLVSLILRSTTNQAETVRVAEAKPAFNSSSAYRKARTLAADFPERAMGTRGSRDAADWIDSQMTRMKLETERQEFTAWIAGERVAGQNIIGIDKGLRDEAIVLIAHYDIPFHVREGAMDDASGVGVLLELARVFSERKQKKTLVFIASDGEEWGMLGARHYASTHARPQSIRAAISLDYVKLENADTIGVRGEGQFRGQMPLWLWILAEDCISAVGGTPLSDGTFAQFISQAVNISSTDQGPFLRVGIPGVNLGSGGSDGPLGKEVYHTVFDTSENLKPEMFKIYGEAVELMVRSLDMLDHSTDNNPTYLRTGRQYYVGRSGLVVMQILLFIPLVLATSFQYYNLQARENFLRNALVEIGNICMFLLPWALAFITLYALVWKNVIPRYELYPATPLDPFLRQPNWKAVAILVVVAIVGWVAVRYVRRALSLSGHADFAASKAVCLDVLVTLAIIALFLNGVAACFFLAPAALLWGWIEAGRKAARFGLNLGLVLASAMPFVLLAVAIAKKLGLGLYVFWYFLLGAGYGFFAPLTVMIALGSATVGVRLLQQSWASVGAEEHDERRAEAEAE